MNSNCYKIIFSKRLGTLVAVGEHTASTGKTASGQACRASVWPSSAVGNAIDGFVGLLKLSFASVSLACLSLGSTQAQSNLPAVTPTALPQNGLVSQGAASISTHGAQMAITQTTDKASINWQSFSIGTAASVNIAQPSASAVLLNRVTGNDPSQILGKLSANGQVILLNPNGVVFGKDGSVTASSFTASTFGLNDADFMNGFYKYQRNGSTAAVVNQGTIEVSSGGFVALMGATVTNEGKIIAPQGDVVLAAAESVTLPEELVTPKQTSKPSTISVRMGKRVRLELDPATINTAVNNTESGVIVTEGGQVLLQSAALSSAVASITQSGSIDTSAPQAGAITVLADNGNINIDGSIKANSNGSSDGTAHRGGDIIIGRDEETGALSKSTNVNAAKLESNKGFVETSGQHITVDGIQVKAAQWLLDPTDITITATDSGTASSGANPITLAPNTSGATASTVSASTLETNLSAGTSVIVKTTNASGTGNGDITVASNIAVTGTTDATLTLQAERDIVVNSNVSIARTGTNKLNVVLNSDLDGNGTGAIVMNSGSSINSNGGYITLGGGTAGTGADYARGYTDATRFTGVSLTGSTLTAAGGDISIKGKGNTTFTNSNDMRGVDLSGTAISTSGSGNITIDGVGGNGNISNTNVGVGITGASTVTGSSGGTVTLTGSASNGGYYNFGVWLSGAGTTVTSPGDINVTGTGGGSGSYGSNPGVMVQQSAAISATGSGNLVVTGTGGDTTGSDNHGVQLAGSGILSSANGNVTITGTSSAHGHSSFGVTIGSAGQVITTGGHVNVTATGQITGQYGYGLWIGDANSKISVGGNGNATITAISSATGSSDALGAQIRSVGAITTNNGNINLTGTSRGAAGNYNIGIGFNGGSLIAGGLGTVTLTGTGGSVGNYAYGVSNANITTSGGSVTINGTSSSTGTGTAGVDATTSAMSTSGGNITISADSYSAGSTETINAGSGTVTIQNRTAATLVDVGSTSADVISGSLKLGVSSAELARITAATVVVGRNDGTGSGNVNLSATDLGALGNTGGNLTVRSGNNITINGAITKSTGTDATLTLNAVNGIDITNAAASVGGTVAGAGKLNVAMTANGNAADVANSSGLVLSKVINANGGTVSLTGTNKKSTGGSGNSGVRLSGASIYAASLSVTGSQTGTSAGSDTNGIYFSGTNTLQTTTGTSTLTGNSNAVGNFGAGIFFADSSSTTFDSGSGSINLLGLNSNTGYRGLRIGGSNNANLSAKGNITFEDTGFQVFLRGQLTQQTNTTVNFKGKGVSMYAGTSVVKAAGATGTTLNLEAQTVVVGDAGGAALTADTINITGNTTGAGTTGVQILRASTVTSSGSTTITSSGPGTSLNSDADTTIAATGGLTVNHNNTGTLASLVTGGTANAGGLTKQGAGTLTLSNANTMKGTTLVSAGTLALNNINAVQSSTLDTGTSGSQLVSFAVAGTNTYNLGALQGADALAIGANTISVGSINSSTTYSGVLSGTGALTKVGTGNLTLSGQSTKTGNYNANAGTLTLTGATGSYRELSGVNVNINNGATVSVPSILNGGFISTNVNWTFGSAGGGTLGINANFVNQGVNGNKFFSTGGATNTITGNINLDGSSGSAGPTFDTAAGTAGAAGIIHSGNALNASASQTLTKAGAGTLVLTGTNDYKGAIAVTAGTLQLGNAGTTGALGDSAGTITVANGASLAINRSNAITLSNTITGAGNLTKAGAGTLTVTGNNNYSGTTTISAGTLQVGNGSTTGSLGSGAVTLSNNANLSFVRSADTTISNAISGTGNVSSSITGSGSDLTVNGTINLTDGLINLAADGNMTLAAAVGTGNASSSAVILNAGKSTSAGSSTGGDLILSGSGTVTVGSGGRATLMSGSIAGSTGLASLVGVGNSRYNSDELSAGYTQAIGSSGLYAIYRESPSLTVTLTNDSKTYNTLAYSGGNGYNVSNTVNGDTAASMGGSIVYGGTAQNAINAGTYTITGSGLTNSLTTSLGYTLAYAAGTLTVGKAALVATANSGTATYNGYDQSLVGSYSVTGLLGSDSTSSFTGISSAGVTRKNAGSYTNTITVADQTNYTVSGVNGTYTIGKAALTATGNSSSVTYNASSQSVSGFTVSGLKGSDTVAGLTGISAAGATATNAGSYSNAMTVVDQSNYTVTGVNGTLTIGKAALVATANSGSVTYNGSNQSISGFTVTGFLGSDTVTGLTGVSASGATAKDFGAYANTMTVADQTNYTVSGVNGTLNIGKANLTLSGTRQYDGGTSFAGAFLTASGVNNETFALTGSGDASNLSSKNVQSSMPLNSVTGLTLGTSTNGGISTNYNALTTTGSSVSVTAKAATVSATPTTLTYNGATQQQTTETSSGFISGDNITITGNASGKNANTYASNLSVTGADAGNYNITLNNANLVIDKAQLLVTASQATKAYDNSLSASGSGTAGTLAGASAGNAVSDNGTQVFLDKNAGINKTVRATGVAIKDTSNADVTNNYDIVYVDNTTSSISKAALTVKANNDARFVTLSDTAGYNGVSYLGFVGGETSSVLGGTLSITRTNASTNLGAQTYTGVLVPSGLTSNNYTIGYTNGNYTIVPAGSLLIRSANETLTYGTATPSFSTTAQYLDGSNVIHTLNRTGTSNNYTFSDGAGGSVAVQLKPYSGSSLAATSTSGNTIVGNYDIKDANPTIVGSNFSGAPVFVGVETVNTKPVTPNATNVSKVYDGSTSMNNVVVGFTGNITNDDLSITGNGAFSQKNVGQNLSYTISGINLSGADAANYSLSGGSSSFTGTNGTITPATLVISSSDVTKVYDRTSTAAGTAIAALGTQIFSTDALSGGSFAFADVNVGTSNKVVTVSGVTVSDGNNGNNYVVSYVDNTTSTITPKALTASYTATNKAYDGNTTATVTGASSDIISGDSVNLSNTSATFDSKNAGLAKTVSVAGISISGSEAGNYSLQNTSATTTADITKKDVTLTAGNVSKTYDGTLVYSATSSDLTPFTSQLISGDTATAAIISFANKNAGTGNKTVTLDQVTVSDGNSGGNYNLTLVGNTTSTITPAALTIKVNDTAMFVTQDANTATNQGFSYTGFKNGETATTALSGGALTISDRVYTGATNFPVAGSYTGVYGLNSGVSALNGNYTIAVQNGNLTVTPADKLLITIASQSEAYGTRTATNVGNTAAGTVTAEYCLSAANCNGANLVSLTTTQISNSQWKATDNTGSYVVFDTSTQTPTYSSGGFLNVGNYGLTASEIAPLSLPNGNFTGRATNGGVLTITPRAVSTSASAVTKTYDGSTQQFGANVMIDNAALNDVVAMTANTSVYASKDVGNNIAVTLNALGLSGTDAANYYLPNSSVSTTGSITPKALSLTGSRVANKVFDGSTQATVTAVGSLQGLVGSEALGLANVEGSFNTPSVGTNKQVVITGVLQDGSNGGLASNYTLTPGSAYADITAASNGSDGGRSIIVPPKPFIPSSNTGGQTTGDDGGGSGSGGGTAGSNPYTVIPNNRRDTSTDKCTPTSLEACVCDSQAVSAVDGVAICYQPQKAANNQTSKDRRI